MLYKFHINCKLFSFNLILQKYLYLKYSNPNIIEEIDCIHYVRALYRADLIIFMLISYLRIRLFEVCLGAMNFYTNTIMMSILTTELVYSNLSSLRSYDLSLGAFRNESYAWFMHAKS